MDNDKEETRGIVVPVLHVIGVRRIGDFGGASYLITRPVLHVVGESTMAARKAIWREYVVVKVDLSVES